MDPSTSPPSPAIGDVPDLNVFDGIVWTALSLAVLTTTLRLFCRSYIVRAFGLDDILILFAQLMAAGSAGVARWHIDYIANIPFQDVVAQFSSDGPPSEMSPGGPPGGPPEGPPGLSRRGPPAGSPSEGPRIPDDPQLREFFDVLFRSAIISDLVYLLTLPLIKCSILAFYYRIVNFKKQRHILSLTAFLVIAQALISFFMTLFAVRPVSAMWNISSADGNSIRFNHSQLQVVNSAFQVFFDVIILALPVPLLLKLKLNRKDRAGLIFIYLLSCFSLAATIVRLHSVIQFNSILRELQSLTQRMAYSYWAMLEIMTAIMCANLPALPALHRYVMNKFKKEPTNVSQSNGQTSTSRKYVIREWFNRSAHSLYFKSRHGKSDSLSQTSSTKEKDFKFKVAHNSRSLDSGTWEKRDHFNNNGVPEVAIDENRDVPYSIEIDFRSKL